MAFDPQNNWTLSKNDKGDNPKRPDYRGELKIDGKTYELAGWIREVKSGRRAGSKFISGSLKPKEERRQQADSEPEKPSQAGAKGGFDTSEDDDKPFG